MLLDNRQGQINDCPMEPQVQLLVHFTGRDKAPIPHLIHAGKKFAPWLAA